LVVSPKSAAPLCVTPVTICAKLTASVIARPPVAGLQTPVNDRLDSLRCANRYRSV
jgi:hypothetical protein